MRLKLNKIFLGAVILLFALSTALASAQHSHDQHSAPAISGQDQQLVKELKGKSGKQAMELAYQWKQKNFDVVSFVTADAVHFKFKDGTAIEVPLPDDQMVVSIAPYINKTHPCATHYMSKCDGELKDTPVKVKAVTAGGKVLIDKTIKTPSYGFIDLWLPRDQEIILSVSAMGKKATGKIYTYRNSKTCDSTLKLE